MAGETRQTAGIESLSNQLMQNSNPAVIPRNHRVEEALEAAVKRGFQRDGKAFGYSFKPLRTLR